MGFIIPAIFLGVSAFLLNVVAHEADRRASASRSHALKAAVGYTNRENSACITSCGAVAIDALAGAARWAVHGGAALARGPVDDTHRTTTSSASPR
jgi:hypothetical protein